MSRRRSLWRIKELILWCANRSNFVRQSNRCNRRNYRISSKAQCSGSHRKPIASVGNGQLALQQQLVGSWYFKLIQPSNFITTINSLFSFQHSVKSVPKFFSMNYLTLSNLIPRPKYYIYKFFFHVLSLLFNDSMTVEFLQ